MSMSQESDLDIQDRFFFSFWLSCFGNSFKHAIKEFVLRYKFRIKAENAYGISEESDESDSFDVGGAPSDHR